MQLNLPPADLVDEDWKKIEGALRNSQYLEPLKALRAAGNAPQAAHRVLPEDAVHQGNEQVNEYLRKANLPYRLTRIGRATHRDRPSRLLAIVKLSDELIARLKEVRKSRGHR